MKRHLFRNILILWGLVVIIFGISPGTGWTEEGLDYVFGPADRLRIAVWETPGLDVEVPVRPDGKISFPLIGDILVAGLTPSQLQGVLVRKLSDFIHDPQVSVLVLQINSLKIYIQGAIALPGEYTLDKMTNILEFFCKAGGLAENADLKRAYLLRKNKRIGVDFYALVEGGDISQNIELKPRDLIFIPYKKAARVIVLGEVNQPQVVTYNERMNVLDAIFMAGGFTEHANRQRIKVIRKNPQHKEIEIDGEAILDDGKIEQNIKLVPADIIIVPESWL